ncbi:hypothetical protein M404DRAFT_36615 [Pisolithus tinctorius Marx 270]|uniref:Uncharacterized protein n=1 Tax=Pisolithus tinctorius Marx 270 TaxID=870435 RepID=A0A0C3NBF7_PISTI|nr:hypothetical protein M404DRAFT_36615 [Pisolithus tinctorius Marx 270]
MASNEGWDARGSGKEASGKSGPETGKGVQGSKAGVVKAEGGDQTQKLLKLSADGEQGRH